MPAPNRQSAAGPFAGLTRDLRHALRTLGRSPGFTAVAVLTLALGIACTTTAFSVVDSIILRGQPYRSAGDLYTAYEQRDDGNQRTPSYPTFLDWQAQTTPASGVIDGVAFVRGNAVSLPGSGSDARIIAAYVSPGFFTLMGTAPFLGRAFNGDEERPGAPPVAVISYDLFLDRFGGDGSVIGRTIDVDSIPTTVVGVMPRAFAYPNFGGNFWLPAQLWQPIGNFAGQNPAVLTLRGLHVDSRTLVRLHPGADSTRAADAMRLIQQRLAAEYPADQAHWTRVAFQSMSAELFGGLSTSLLLISGAIALVLLLACANVANLFIVRGAGRSRELAVRVALGAGRWRIVRQLLSEALLVALAAGAIGGLLASVLVDYARHSLGALLPMSDRIAVDGRALAFTFGASLATALIVGLGPALGASGSRLMLRIRSGGMAASGQRHDRLGRNLLVSLQFALALTLLIGSGLLIQSFRRLTSVPLGYDPNDQIGFAIDPGAPQYNAPDAAAALYARILDAVAALPGVESSSATGGALLSTTVARADAGAPAQAALQAIYHPVSTDYLRTMRIAMTAGRWFTPQDMRAAGGLVINEQLATTLWGKANPLGERITIHRQSQARADFGQPITLPVIGVVADIHEYGPAFAPTAEVYLPYTLEVWPWMTFAVRAHNAARLVRPVKEAVRAVDPSVRFRSEPSVTPSGAGLIGAQQRFVTEVLAGFALGALLLAAIGLYGIVAYHVTQRTRELGIRIALGASSGNVLWLVVRDSAVFVIVGAAAGMAGALASARLLQSFLFQTTGTDVQTFLLVPLALAVVALAASVIPARRAARTDPTIAMRAE